MKKRNDHAAPVYYSQSCGHLSITKLGSISTIDGDVAFCANWLSPVWRLHWAYGMNEWTDSAATAPAPALLSGVVWHHSHTDITEAYWVGCWASTSRSTSSYLVVFQCCHERIMKNLHTALRKGLGGMHHYDTNILQINLDWVQCVSARYIKGLIYQHICPSYDLQCLLCPFIN